MADIKNYTLNFGSGRPRWCAALTCAARKSACTGIELRRAEVTGGGFEGR
jgi:hypothetical protein